MIHTLKYDNLTVTYEMEGDCDGSYANIEGIKDENGLPVSVDKETEKDMMFLAKCEFADLQFAHYMRTGETL